MEKDPGRRYQTMADFEDDLRRLLAGEVIQARPAGAVRRTAKWVRRHKFFSVASSAVLVVLAASVFVQHETSRRRDEEHRIAMERFKPVAKAMELSSLDDWTHYLPWTWCLEADIGDPSGHMLCALFHLESGKTEEAISCLRECIARCRERGERSLEADAHYLLGIVTLTLADLTDIESDRREQLHKEALSRLQAAGEFDFMSPDAFVWRETVRPHLASGRKTPSIHEIKINSEHFLVRLFVGSYLFFDLYKGGETGKFERTIDCFTEVLEQRPDNVIACTYLGRTYYFLAEHFDFLDQAETAKDYLERGLAAAGENANNLLHATLGSVHLLRGDLVAARSSYESAMRSAEGRYQMNVHNAVAGIGAVYARQGRIEEALEKYQETLAMQIDDMPARVAMTELHLLRGEMDDALRHAERMTYRIGRSAFARGVTKPASAYLTYARVCLVRGEHEEAREALHELYEFTVFSVRDFSLACILVTTFPEEWLDEENGRAARLVVLANQLAEDVEAEAQWGERISPVSLSAAGANAYLRGRYEEAIDALQRATRERERWWSEPMRNYVWTEDARDRYLLAMAHFKLAEESAGNREIHVQEAHACYDTAEELYRTRARRIGVLDVIDGVRTKAGEVLGVSP
jgi:tetratricopeptide (TPR) repeat protein